MLCLRKGAGPKFAGEQVGEIEAGVSALTCRLWTGLAHKNAPRSVNESVPVDMLGLALALARRHRRRAQRRLPKDPF